VPASVSVDEIAFVCFGVRIVADSFTVG
jgi:hypothetical protein